MKHISFPCSISFCAVSSSVCSLYIQLDSHHSFFPLAFYKWNNWVAIPSSPFLISCKISALPSNNHSDHCLILANLPLNINLHHCFWTGSWIGFQKLFSLNALMPHFKVTFFFLTTSLYDFVQQETKKQRSSHLKYWKRYQQNQANLLTINLIC